MPSEKYHKEYLEKQFPVELREQLRANALDPTRLPTYDYLNAKGFETRGLTRAVKRHYGDEKTLHEFLREQGFGYQKNSRWPTEHQETISLLNGYRESRSERNDDADTTLSTVESALRTVLRTAQDIHGTDNLLFFARYDTENEKYRRNKQTEAIIDRLKAEISGGATGNYVRYFREFYEYAKLRTRIDQNPVSQVEVHYDFDTRSETDVQPLTDKQIRTLWETLKQLPDRDVHAVSVKNLAKRHGLREWQVRMMVLVVLGIGVGPRSQEYIRTQCREDWVLDDDPYIDFPIRKNLPGQVPVLAHPELLDAFREYMEATQSDWNGKPFPSTTSESGSRCGNTLNNWLKALCEEAGVRLDDGNYPTLQNLRQTWHNQYHQILRKNKVQLQLVAEEQGTQDERQVKMSYRTEDEERKSIRTLATRDFEELLPFSELPDVMSEVIEVGEYFEEQADLSDFSGNKE